jgi:hypothetical protein
MYLEQLISPLIERVHTSIQRGYIPVYTGTSEYILCATALFPPASKPGWLGYTLLARLKTADWLMLKDTYFKQQQLYSFKPFFSFFAAQPRAGPPVAASS